MSIKNNTFLNIYLKVFLLVGGVFLLQGLITGFFHETNDDYGILNATLLVEHPCVYYSSAIYSSLLVNLGKYLGLFDWHSFIMVISNVIVYSLFITLTLFYYKQQQQKIIISLFILCLLYPFNFIYLQYTSSSTLLACATYIGLYILIKFNKITILHLLSLCILFSLSFLLRKDALFLISGICFPILMIYAGYKQKWYVPIFLALFGLLLMSLENTCVKYNCNKEGLEIQSFRAATTDGFIDSKELNQKILDTLNISKNDLLLLREFFMEDPLLANSHTYQTIANLITLKKNNSIIKQIQMTGYEIFTTLLKSVYFYLFFLMVITAILLNFYGLNRRVLFVFIFIFASYLICCIYLTVTIKNIPNYIHRPVFFSLGVFSFLLFRGNNFRTTSSLQFSRANKMIFCLTFAAFLGVIPQYYSIYNPIYKGETFKLSQIFSEIPDMHKTKYVYTYPPLGKRRILAFDSWDTLRTVPYKDIIGCMNLEPSHDIMKKKLYGTETSFLEIMLNDSTLHIAPEEKIHYFYQKRLCTYIEERTCKKCSVDIIKSTKENYHYFKFQVKETID